MIKSVMKGFVDRKLPLLSSNYRRIRDHRHITGLRPYNTALGFRIYGDPDMDTSRLHSYEVQVFAKYLERSDVVIDIGANVGLFTCLAAQAGKKVVAIEPQFYNLQCLYKNLQINNFESVEVLPVAVSSAVGIMPLFGGGQGATLLSGWGGVQSNYHTLVPVNTLDNLLGCRFAGKRMLIKIDVEGNEFQVLQGAKSILGSLPAPIWIVEHGLTENFDGSANPFFKQLFDTFWEYKYKAYTVEKEPREVTPGDVERWTTNKAKDFGNINYVFRQEECDE